EQEDAGHQRRQHGDAQRRGAAEQQQHAAGQAGGGDQRIDDAALAQGGGQRLRGGRFLVLRPRRAEQGVRPPAGADVGIERGEQPAGGGGDPVHGASLRGDDR